MNDQARDTRQQRASEHGEESFPLDPERPLAIMVDNPNGQVSIRGTERTDLVVRYQKHGVPGTTAYDEAQLLIEAEANRLTVRPILPSGSDWSGAAFSVGSGRATRSRFAGGGVRVVAGRAVAETRRAFAGAVGQAVWYDLEVELPSSAIGSDLDLASASGRVAVEAVTGKTRVRTASGEVELRASRGEIAIETASGRATIEGAHGPLRVRTASGEVRITAHDVPSLSLETASGDVQFSGLLAGKGPFGVKTVSGEVVLDLAAPALETGGEPDLSLAFQTVSGSAAVPPPFRAAGRRAWRVGSGNGPRVSVKTVSGDLTVSLEERAAPSAGAEAQTTASPSVPVRAEPPPEPPTPPEPPEPPNSSIPPEPAEPPEPEPPVSFPGSSAVGHDESGEDESVAADESPLDRLEVLRAVERGELDIEEALRRLDGGADGPR